MVVLEADTGCVKITRAKTLNQNTAKRAILE